MHTDLEAQRQRGAKLTLPVQVARMWLQAISINELPNDYECFPHTIQQYAALHAWTYIHDAGIACTPDDGRVGLKAGSCAEQCPRSGRKQENYNKEKHPWVSK